MVIDMVTIILFLMGESGRWSRRHGTAYDRSRVNFTARYILIPYRIGIQHTLVYLLPREIARDGHVIGRHTKIW